MIYLAYCNHHNITFIAADANYHCKFMCKIYIAILIHTCMDYE